jgi:hypothetical protein
MTFRGILVVLPCALVAACSVFSGGEAQTVDKDADGIRFKVGYDAAVEGVDTRTMAAEHCAGHEKKAVWYGHDRDGNMLYKCE